MAMSIRIQGLRNLSQQNIKNAHPLKDAITEAIEHFSSILPHYQLPGFNDLHKLISLPTFPPESCEEISNNFQKIVLYLGESVCGDEKLFHFTGNSRDIRFVPMKPSRIGFWFYELTAPLRYGGHFLLHTRLHYGSQYSPVSEAVRSWVNVVKKYQFDNPLLTMDAYYLDNSSKAVLDESHVLYVGSAAEGRFREVQDHMVTKVNSPGEWYGIHNPETRDSFVYHWSNNANLGKKWIVTNACELKQGSSIDESVPVYGLYRATFSACDQYNLELHNRTWPYRKGGFKQHGELGAQSNFLFSCILLNTMNAFFEIKGLDRSTLNFKECCVELANQLFLYASQH